VGEARPNLNRSSDLFDLELISTPDKPLLLLHKKPLLDQWAEEAAPLSGKLVLYDRCPRVRSDSGLVDYVPLWPPEVQVQVEAGQIRFVDGVGGIVASVWEEVRLAGRSFAKNWDVEEYSRLALELPGECHGPYWIVADEPTPQETP
jgi:hypothetical protein